MNYSDAKKIKGFTILEILIVLLLLAILTALASPGAGRFLDSMAIRKQTHSIMATLRFCRLKAVSEGREVRVTLAENGVGGFTISGAVEKNVEYKFAEEDRLSMEPGEIVFYPEGYATPARLEFEKGERRKTILLDPLTGLPYIE